MAVDAPGRRASPGQLQHVRFEWIVAQIDLRSCWKIKTTGRRSAVVIVLLDD
jgi:hypothetical protein